MTLRYVTIERQIVERLPELRTPAERYWASQGPPGEDPGPYIFSMEVFEPFVEILLAARESPRRDRLLKRCFALIDDMLTAEDRALYDLAGIQFLEYPDPWWLGRAMPFLGPAAIADLREHQAQALDAADADARADAAREILDLSGARDAVLAELEPEGVSDVDLAGIASRGEWTDLPSLDVARETRDGVAFVSCFGTSRPYVIAPMAIVRCDTDALQRMAEDVAVRDATEPDQARMAGARLLRIRIGERVWQMNDELTGPHARWTGRLWISARVKELALESGVRAVLAGLRSRIGDGDTRGSDRLPYDRTDG